MSIEDGNILNTGKWDPKDVNKPKGTISPSGDMHINSENSKQVNHGLGTKKGDVYEKIPNPTNDPEIAKENWKFDFKNTFSGFYKKDATNKIKFNILKLVIDFVESGEVEGSELWQGMTDISKKLKNLDFDSTETHSVLDALAEEIKQKFYEKF